MAHGLQIPSGTVREFWGLRLTPCSGERVSKRVWVHLGQHVHVWLCMSVSVYVSRHRCEYSYVQVCGHTVCVCACVRVYVIVSVVCVCGLWGCAHVKVYMCECVYAWRCVGEEDLHVRVCMLSVYVSLSFVCVASACVAMFTWVCVCVSIWMCIRVFWGLSCMWVCIRVWVGRSMRECVEQLYECVCVWSMCAHHCPRGPVEVVKPP